MRDDIAKIRWNLYRTKEGARVVYGNTPATYTPSDRAKIEKWLMKFGIRPEELDKLFRDAEEKGEGAITYSLVRGIEEYLESLNEE
jgi:hypothetical protein